MSHENQPLLVDENPVWHCVPNEVLQKFGFFFCILNEYVLVFLDHFDVLMSKIIFKKLKNIILIYFGMKSTLKSYRNRTPKQALSIRFVDIINKYKVT